MDRFNAKKPPDKSSPDSSKSTTTGGSGSPAWASMTSAMTYKEMSLTLQHVGDIVPTPLTRKEIIQLLVQKLGLTPDKLLGIDNSFWKSIKVRVPPTTDIDAHLNINAIILKPGLRLEPSKRLDKEVWVKIYRCSFNDVIEINEKTRTF